MTSKQLTAIIGGVVAIATGGIEMRAAVARLEVSASNIEKRVERIEADVDAARRNASR